MVFSSIVEVIIDKPLLPLNQLGFNATDAPSLPVFTNERYLPKILVSIGFFKSNSEVRKNRPDLVITLDTLDMIELKIGKKLVWILVVLTDEDYTQYEKQELLYFNN